MSEVSGQVASAQSKVVKWIKYYPNCNTMIKKKMNSILKNCEIHYIKTYMIRT